MGGKDLHRKGKYNIYLWRDRDWEETGIGGVNSMRNKEAVMRERRKGHQKLRVI